MNYTMNFLHTTEDLYQEADEMLEAAEHQLERAEEDVITHMVCSNSRHAISHYLKGFLLNRNVPIIPPASIASLQQQCQAIDPRFEWLDLYTMRCRYDAHPTDYCLDLESVTHCLHSAQQVRSIVTAEMPAY